MTYRELINFLIFYLACSVLEPIVAYVTGMGNVALVLFLDAAELVLLVLALSKIAEDKKYRHLFLDT